MLAYLKNNSGIIWLAPLIALHGIPGTGFVRSIFLLIGLIHLFWTIKNNEPIFSLPHKRPETWLLGALTLWLVIQSSVFSVSPLHSIKELSDHFGKILLLIWVAITFVRRRSEINSSWMLHGVFAGFFIHVVSTLSFQGWQYFSNSNLAIGDSFLGNYGYVSPYVTGSMAFLIADLASRYLGSGRLLNVPTWTIISGLFLAIAAQSMLAAKASLVMMIIMFFIASAAVMIRSRNSLSRLFVLAALGITIGAGVTFTNFFSNRWDGALENIDLAIKQESDLKSTFQGTFQGDGSFSLRYSWGKAGIEGIAHRPLGYGYGSEGYGKYISDHYNITGAVSSHSGWIDYTLDNGIPGLILLLALSAILVYRGWRSFLQGNPLGLALCLFVINYIGRCAIDGHLVGSRITGFAFAAAILWALNMATKNANPSN